MIYFFGTGDKVKVIFGGNNLSESEKEEATLVLNSLPPTQTPSGKMAKFFIDPTTKAFSYVYIDKVQEAVVLNYEEMTTTQLKELCKQREITGYSSMTKSELISALEEYDEENKGG